MERASEIMASVDIEEELGGYAPIFALRLQNRALIGVILAAWSTELSSPVSSCLAESSRIVEGIGFRVSMQKFPI